MDTVKFQQMDIILSEQEINKILDEVDANLGEVSHFARNSFFNRSQHASQLAGQCTIVPFLLEAIFFGISMEDFYGRYGLNCPLIRFNLKVNTQLIDFYLQEIIEKRIFFMVLSGVVFAAVVWVYYMQKYRNLFSDTGMVHTKKEYVYSWIRETKTKLEEMQQQKKIKKFGRSTNIYQYLFQLGYKKGILYCVCLDVAAMILVGEMGGYILFQRFLLLNGIILFSCIESAEQEGDCKSLLYMKDRIHIGQIQFGMSTLISLLIV